MKKFWMVVRESKSVGYRTAEKRHPTEKSAADEARRLCELERDTFFVLEATAYASYPKPRIRIVATK